MTLVVVDIPSALLAHLRRSLSNDRLSYSEAPARITGGYDTSIYSFRLAGAPDGWSRPLILRLFRPDTEPERPRFERAVHNAVASLGYPAPRVLLTHDELRPLGGGFLVMERLPGRIMLDLFFRPNRKWLSLARIMAYQHARLHALDVAPFERAAAPDGVSLSQLDATRNLEWQRGNVERLRLANVRDAIAWLDHHAPAASQRVSICHGDFHPLNILIDRGDVTGVIDWSWASVGDPAYDVGATVAIFSHGPVDLPDFARPAVDFFRRRFLADYLSEYQKLHPLDLERVRYYEALRCLGFVIEGCEHLLADAGRVERPIKASAFAERRQLDGIARRFAEITGVNVALPGPRL